MPQRVVEQVGQHALHQTEIGAYQRQTRRELSMQALPACLRGQFEFLQHVLQQFRQREYFPLQPHFTVLQPRQFEQCPGKTTDLGALRQRDTKIATALLRRQRGFLQRQRFQVTVQRGQRRTQVMRDVGHQFAALQVLLAQLLPLFAQPLCHLCMGMFEDLQLIALARAQRYRCGQRRRCVDVEGLYAPGDLAQWPGHPIEGHQAGKQAQPAYQQHRPQRGVPLAAGGQVIGQHLPVFAHQHHVHVAGLPPLHHQRRDTEHLAAIRAARIVTEDRQRRAGQQAP
ncbi:hypothetical protein D3C72_1495920 [compost metagenome]